MTTSNGTSAAANDTNRSGLSSVTDRVRESGSAVRSKAGEAYSAAKERTHAAYGSARETASSAARRASTGVDANPVAALLGGAAIGAAVAAIIPMSRRESDLLGDLGRRLNEQAKSAAGSAQQAGVAKLNDFGLDTAREKLAELAGNGSSSAA